MFSGPEEHEKVQDLFSSSEHKSCEYSLCYVGLSRRIRRNFYCIGCEASMYS